MVPPRESWEQMIEEPQAVAIAGDRLHLHHGPIDLIIGGEGPDRDAAYRKATERFQTILTDIIKELDELRQPPAKRTFKSGPARRMETACDPYAEDAFLTPMAAVAGSVADEMLEAAVEGLDLAKLYVNNGGDIAFHLAPGATVRAVGLEGPIDVTSDDPVRGIATSGWRGRSLSFGIADAVTVLAKTAAAADAAATMIANAVDLPGHPAIKRGPAAEWEIAPELGESLVTTDVGPLSADETETALDRGLEYAKTCMARGLICGAQLSLNGQTRVLQ